MQVKLCATAHAQELWLVNSHLSMNSCIGDWCCWKHRLQMYCCATAGTFLVCCADSLNKLSLHTELELLPALAFIGKKTSATKHKLWHLFLPVHALLSPFTLICAALVSPSWTVCGLISILWAQMLPVDLLMVVSLLSRLCVACHERNKIASSADQLAVLA